MLVCLVPDYTGYFYLKVIICACMSCTGNVFINIYLIKIYCIASFSNCFYIPLQPKWVSLVRSAPFESSRTGT